MSVGERIRDLRVQKRLTQSELAEAVGLTYIQVGRYETQKSKPSAEVLGRLARALDTTADYLMNGSGREAAAAQLSDRELLQQFRAVELLDEEDKKLIKTFIDAFLTKRQVQKLAR